jgi:hypothetical protein
MENSDCGIAASADPDASPEKIRYDVELNWKIQIFSNRTRSGPANRVLNLRIARPTFKFLLPDGKFGKTGIGPRVIRCGLLPRTPLNMAAQAHSNP